MSPRVEITPAPRHELARTTMCEVRVVGQLDGAQWAEWFDGMTVIALRSGETVITGPVADQAALYGLIARLRDLALPLKGIEISEVEEGRIAMLPPNERRRPRIGWRLIVVYLLLIGGFAALTVLLTSSGIVATALALALLFGALGGVGYAFYRLDRVRVWLLLAILEWIGASICLTIYLTSSGFVPTALALGLWCLGLAGMLLYQIAYAPGKVSHTKADRGEPAFDPLRPAK
ncbi:MAG: hypothetical protein IT326_04440 [Anaerolineae bacterium]|nr:hypothetical protein [Anaerolineae bacterium]